TGTAGLEFGALNVDPGAVIDASTSSGRQTVSVAAGQSYLGGTGVDTVTSGAVAQVGTVSGGGGGADKLILTSSVNAGAATAALFKDFEILQANTGVVANVGNFTGSAFTAVILSGNAEVGGMNAVQAANVSLAGGAQAIVLGLGGAMTAGQLDSVTLTNATAAATLATPSLAGVETLNLVDAKAMTINGLTSATALTTINASGAGNLSITTGALALNVNTVIDAHLSTGSVSIDASGSLANGLTIIGSATGVNQLTGNASQKNTLVGGSGGGTLRGGSAADVLTAGNGNHTIIGGGGNDTITAGNGDNTINADGTGASSITAGNGWNVITGGSGADIVKVGSGGNLVTGGRGADAISFGSHDAGVIDGLVYGGLNGANDTGAAITASGIVAGVDVIAGLHRGDSINLGQPAGALANDLGGAFAHAVAAGTAAAECVRGNYAASTGMFTATANGADSLLAWADGSASHGTAAIVLLGYAGAAASAMSAGGIVTLG
ncbi:MAG TPA: calcium-binding protein, partial [Burkholderiaceae bacterium]|nr:calcium-binding protein [Burkholderiaceae bacterium]